MLKSCFIFPFVAATMQQSVLDGIIGIVEEGTTQFNMEPPDTPFLYKEYDFIVVGAGIGGCVVANRLSENPNWKILLIEAGPAENYLADVPLLVNYLQFTTINWKYKTVPSSKFCLGLDKHQCNFPRGKMVGGSSVLNYMTYTRGNRRDYDNWAALGNTGWSFDEVLPYFKKIENFSVDSHFPDYHGTHGYLGISYAPFESEIAKGFIQGSLEYGLKHVDYNGPTQTGVSRPQLTIKDGVRHSASRAYLHPIRNRVNFQIKKEATVSKVLINPKTKQALGVEFYKNGKKFVVKATKEVIVSAGAINSPQLLMLSGIGPKKHLEEIGIPVLSKLKVGYNLMDHILLGGLSFLINKLFSFKTKNMISVENLRNFLNYHKGPWTVPGGLEVVIFHDFSHPNSPDGYPEIELFLISGSFTTDPILIKNFGLDEDLYQTVYAPFEDYDSFSTCPMLMRPKSRGRVVLKNGDFKSKPLIFPNYLAHEDDVNSILNGALLALNITMQPSLQKMGAKFNPIPLPQCAKFKFLSRSYLKCMLEYITLTVYHQSGTCKMGPSTDKSAVVDPRLRVYGIKGLRVIDAAVIPVIPAAHISAPIYMIAEKGAEMIKEDWVNL